ncbi:MAG: TRAP transporter large permease subunit [Chloroflexi bacterium]|nr:MAG: TRAP transporter large permease subunit [Chloroflexota bacterium]
MSALLLIVLGLLALWGTPLFVILGAVSLYLFSRVDIPAAAVIIEMYRLTSSPLLVTIPLFTFTGYLLAASRAPQRIIALTRPLCGWMPGGLAVVTLLSCAFFTAFTGASGVTIIALGGLLYPILRQEQYAEQFSLGLLTTSGSLGLLFPPSLPLILYGLVAKVSVDQLFLAGIIPGSLLLLLLAGYGSYTTTKHAVPRYALDLRAFGKAAWEAKWEVPLPFLILIGIYGGLVTVSEAAAIAAFYVLVVEALIHREVHFIRDIPRLMQESMTLVGGILIILGMALGLTNFLIDAQVPMRLFALMQGYITSRAVFLLMLNAFLLVVGALLDIFSAIIVVVPLILPIAQQFHIDPVHLGIIFLTNLEIGYFTPPVGINLFIGSLTFERPVLHLYRATLPFLLVYLIALLLITYVPGLSLGLLGLLD